MCIDAGAYCCLPGPALQGKAEQLAHVTATLEALAQRQKEGEVKVGCCRCRRYCCLVQPLSGPWSASAGSRVIRLLVPKQPHLTTFGVAHRAAAERGIGQASMAQPTARAQERPFQQLAQLPKRSRAERAGHTETRVLSEHSRPCPCLSAAGRAAAGAEGAGAHAGHAPGDQAAGVCLCCTAVCVALPLAQTSWHCNHACARQSC